MQSEALKLQFIKEYLQIEDKQVLQAVQDFFYQVKDKLGPSRWDKQLAEHLKKDVIKAVENERDGHLKSIEDLEKKIQTWN